MGASNTDREIVGPFELDGLQWGLCGHIGLVTDASTARQAFARLQELGFEFYRATPEGNSEGPARLGNTFEYKFMHPTCYETQTHRFEIVTIIMVPLRYADRPDWEIVFTTDSGATYQRFGDKIFIGPDHVDATLLIRAETTHGPGNILVRPALF